MNQTLLPIGVISAEQIAEKLGYNFGLSAADSVRHSVNFTVADMGDDEWLITVFYGSSRIQIGEKRAWMCKSSELITTMKDLFDQLTKLADKARGKAAL